MNMKDLNTFIIVRTLHIVGAVFWIGDVAFVTMVLIPSLKNNITKNERMDMFVKLESIFSFQAKISTLVVGIIGVYMLFFMNAWSRYLQPQYWWMHPMTIV